MRLDFVPCRYTGKTANVTDPFTKEVMNIAAPEPLTRAQWEAVRKILTIPPARFEGDDWKQLADGGVVKVYFSGPNPMGEGVAGEGATIEVGNSGLTADVLRLVSDLLHAAEWVCCSEGFGKGECIVGSPNLVKGAFKEYGRAVVCESLDELTAFLVPRHKKWLADQNRKVEAWLAKKRKESGK